MTTIILRIIAFFLYVFAALLWLAAGSAWQEKKARAAKGLAFFALSIGLIAYTLMVIA